MRKLGFTLLEIVIAVIIVGILSAFAIPQFNQSVLKSHVAKAQNAISLLVEAEKLYQLDNGVYLSTGTGNLDADIGDGVTGIDIGQIDGDTDWDYTVNAGASTITAIKQANPCLNASVVYNLLSGAYAYDACLRN